MAANQIGGLFRFQKTGSPYATLFERVSLERKLEVAAGTGFSDSHPFRSGQNRKEPVAENCREIDGLALSHC